MNRMLTLWIAVALAMGLAPPVLAGTGGPALEAREQRLAHELRCVVCQNQSVAESNAPLAADMRREIRNQLQAGRSDAEVVDFFEQRYGAFVHYKPPLQPNTWLLWGAPFVLGLGGLVLLWRLLRRRHRQALPEPLSAAQRERVRRLLDEDTAS